MWFKSKCVDCFCKKRSLAVAARLTLLKARDTFRAARASKRVDRPLFTDRNDGQEFLTLPEQPDAGRRRHITQPDQSPPPGTRRRLLGTCTPMLPWVPYSRNGNAALAKDVNIGARKSS